jgi:hypothetical protein
VDQHHQELGVSIGISCLACCYGSQASLWKSWRKVPKHCAEAFSQKCRLGKTEIKQQENMVDLSSSGLGNSNHTASPRYHAPWFELSTGICATWVWTHQTEQASLHLTVVHRLSWIQGLTLNTRCHGLIIAATQVRNEVTWSPSHLVIRHQLFSSHQDTLTRKWICTKLAWVSCVSWGSYIYEFWDKAIFLSMKPSW